MKKLLHILFDTTWGPAVVWFVAFFAAFPAMNRSGTLAQTFFALTAYAAINFIVYLATPISRDASTRPLFPPIALDCNRLQSAVFDFNPSMKGPRHV